MDLEKQLRTGLSARAAEIDAAPTGLLDDVLAGHRRSVHRRRAALVAGVAAVLVAVAVPVGVTVTGGADGGDSSQAPVQGAFERYPIEPRGNLAEDAGYVDGLLARDWWPASVGPQPAPDTRQVVFAADVPDGVMALVTGWLDGARTGQWLGGPPGATAQELTPIAEPVPVADGQPQAFLRFVDDAGALVVVAAPGDVVEVSPRQEIAASGEIVRAPYETVGEPDGTAVVDVASLDRATFGVRVTRDGVPQEVAGGGSGSTTQDVEPDLGAGLDGAPGDPDPDLVRELVRGVLERLGLDGDGVPVGVLWGGPIGNRIQPAEAAVVTVGLPSGATVLVVGMGYGQDDVGEFSSVVGPCGQAILPAGATVDDWVVAVRCELRRLDDGASLGSQLVVVPPAGTATVQLTGAGGAVIDTRQLTGPAYVGPAPDGLQGAVALDADGAVLAQAPLLGLEPLQLD
ncbi:hypothetical protein SAMN05660199_00235 [Klenkia soli]|uniref:Uncharacterized protein n=1 Tax=Klenkia soli TaxID=1052260 RepID=A0A1H0C8R7_9ACTN|nr:hypothetical protein [Klenkia soli]SDN54196.1 hypothetical protein SAMN05660199_00235 [Klenkia soli]